MLRRSFFFSFLLLTATALASPMPCTENTCIGVVDVGSTGSRLHVYRVKQDASEAALDQIWLKKITPGFAALPIQSDLLNHYLDELFEDAPGNFPVYFYASAGMRLLPSEKQAKYYQAVQSWFQHSAWHLKEARTLTGHEEGIFAWLAVRENLKQTTGMAPPKNLSVMDMGGASVQIISAVDTPKDTSTTDYVDITLNGKPHTLFVHSFLGLGQTLVSNQFLDEPSCFPEGYPLSSGAIGTGDVDHCTAKMSTLIEDIHDVNHVLPPALYADSSSSWYVIAGLSYLMQEAPFNQYTTDNALTNDGLMAQAERTVCHRDWALIQQDYPNEENLSRACLRAAYYHALIKAYGIAPREPIHLISEPSDVDWTLGVALQKG